MQAWGDQLLKGRRGEGSPMHNPLTPTATMPVYQLPRSLFISAQYGRSPDMVPTMEAASGSLGICV